jgi:molecular chaperone DnaK
MRLFLSYARVDAIPVGELAAVLRAAGFDPWWDDRLEPGDDWKAELKRRIAACGAFLYLLSPDSVESEWCGWELAQAAQLGKAIMPILVRAGTPLPTAVAHLQYLDASGGLRNIDVARLVGKLGRIDQQHIREPVAHHHSPAGIPARFRRPLPKNYRTIAQAYLQPLSGDLPLYQRAEAPPSQLPPTSSFIGIDFGTTMSSVAVEHEGEVELIPNNFGETSTPSAVAIATDGTVLVGQHAVNLLMQRPERGVLEVKRLFGDDLLKEFGGPPVLVVDGAAYTPLHLAGFIFRKLREDAESYLQRAVRDSVLAAPAYFDASQCGDLVRAAQLAGLRALRVIPEPVAACMGVMRAAKDDVCALVYDLGGGTFDASVVEVSDGVFEVKAVNGDTRLGGADFDRTIVDYCVEVFRDRTGVDISHDPIALMRIRESAERAKIALSSVRASTISVPFIAASGARSLHLNVELTRTRFNELTHALIEQTEYLSRAAVEDAGLTTSEIQKVLVVGRAARASGIHQALEDIFEHRLQAAPDHVVALGAALQGGVLSGDVKNWLLLDSLAHTIRVQVVGGRSIPLLVRNKSIPYRVELTLRAQGPEQTKMVVLILAGESSWASQNLPLVNLRVDCVTPLASYGHLVLRLEIDANSVAEVTVRGMDGSLKAKEICSLRGNSQDRVPPRQQPAPPEEALLPAAIYPVRFGSFPNPEGVDVLLAQRWLSRTLTELILKGGHAGTARGRFGQMKAWLRANPHSPVPADFADDRMLQIFDIERELMVDALEQRFRMDLTAVRYCSSINSMAQGLVRSLHPPKM